MPVPVMPLILLYQLEVVLQRDGGIRLRLFLDADAFFRLDRLVQAVAPTGGPASCAR